MRISDWSSDVCSSDLKLRDTRRAELRPDPFLQLRRLHGLARLQHDGRRQGFTPFDRRHAHHRDILHDIVRAQHVLDFARRDILAATDDRSEEHTSELQSLMSISYAVFCLTKKKQQITTTAHV